jgi:hypothetical protein
MICRESIPELVECARDQAVPGRELRAHLATCADCRQRWDAEQQLTAHLRVMRIRTSTLKSPASRREALMREFARQHQQRVTPLRPAPARAMPAWAIPAWAIPAWGWTLAAAAAVLIAVLIGQQAGLHSRNTVLPAARTHSVHAFGAILYEASADASALSTDDFVAVPYTPPLAAGEMVRMVHADMYPEALTSMGVAVDPAWSGNLPVDMVVGEDGLPRAVRISDNGQN